MTTYQLTPRNVVVLRDDGAQVPVDNPVYLAWLAAGNTPDPALPDPPPDPQEVADNITLDGLRSDYLTLIGGLDRIQADMATLGANATTLSTITVTTLAQVQAALRSLGTDLGTLVDDTNALAVGAERVLNVARVFVRRQGG